MSVKGIYKKVPTKEVATQVLNQFIVKYMDGGGIRDVCKDMGMSMTEFYNMLDRFPGLDAVWQKCRARRADTEADQVIDIADNDPDYNRARNRMMARQWYASKMRPEIYGDKIDINVSTTVDVNDALTQARNRAKLPIVKAEYEVISDTSDATDSDSVSDTSSESLIPPNSESDEDIFT